MDSNSLRGRLERALGRPSDTKAEDICELITLRHELTRLQKRCRELEGELVDALQLASDSMIAYQELCRRTKEQLGVQR